MPYGEPGAYWLLLGPDINLRHTRYDLTFPSSDITRPPEIPGILHWEHHAGEWTAVCDNTEAGIQDKLQAQGANISNSQQPTLEEIFLARVGVPADTVHHLAGNDAS